MATHRIRSPASMKPGLRYTVYACVITLCISLSWPLWRYQHYFASLQTLASEGITSHNYLEIMELVKTLPNTQRIFDVRSSTRLIGNERITNISRTPDYIAASLYFRSDRKTPDDHRATISYTFPSPVNLSDAILFATIRLDTSLVGHEPSRSGMKITLVDWHGNFMHGSAPPVRDDGIAFAMVRITTQEPLPSGSAYLGFDTTRIARLIIQFTLGKTAPGQPVQGTLYLDNVYAFSNTELLTNLFRPVDYRRVTSDSLNISYELRKKLWERSDAHVPFFYGVNLPWYNYGWDAGKNPYGDTHDGWSTKESRLRDDFLFLKSIGITVVRVFVFSDLRTGLVYDQNRLVGFDEYVWKDVEALVRIAGETGMRIIPVLFDFHIADGIGWESKTGEHPELIFYGEKEYFLQAVLRPFIAALGRWDRAHGHPILAVDLMNEPENMAMLAVPGFYPGLYGWLKDAANIVHRESSLRVTLGSKSLVDAQRWWNGIDIDLWQFHFYPYMERDHEQDPLRTARTKIPLPGIIFAGELPPHNIGPATDTIQKNGYRGTILWSWYAADGLSLPESHHAELLSLIDRIEKTKKTP